MTEDLQKGCPSGENPNDLSVYRMHASPISSSHHNPTDKKNPGAPTLYCVNGSYTEICFKTYYENIDRAEIPFLKDLHMVAGNASAKSQTVPCFTLKLPSVVFMFVRGLSRD